MITIMGFYATISAFMLSPFKTKLVFEMLYFSIILVLTFEFFTMTQSTYSVTMRGLSPGIVTG
jgi:hypothetical protein